MACLKKVKNQCLVIMSLGRCDENDNEEVDEEDDDDGGVDLYGLVQESLMSGRLEVSGWNQRSAAAGCCCRPQHWQSPHPHPPRHTHSAPSDHRGKHNDCICVFLFVHFCNNVFYLFIWQPPNPHSQCFSWKTKVRNHRHRQTDTWKPRWALVNNDNEKHVSSVTRLYKHRLY